MATTLEGGEVALGSMVGLVVTKRAVLEAERVDGRFGAYGGDASRFRVLLAGVDTVLGAPVNVVCFFSVGFVVLGAMESGMEGTRRGYLVAKCLRHIKTPNSIAATPESLGPG